MVIPHLDQEALSAALDGEGSPEEAAHLAACRRCQAGVAQMAVVARAVGAPVATRPAADVTAAVDRALAERDGPAASPVGVRGVAALRPGPRRTILPARSDRPARGSGRGSGRWVTAAAGLAAAVLVVAAVAGIMKQAGGPAHNTTSAAAPTRESPSTTARGLLPSSASPADLGEQSDTETLARMVRGLLTMADAKAALAAPPAPVLGSAPGGANYAAPPPPCAAQGPAAAGITGSGSEAPSLVTSLRWRGEPSVLLVYRGSAGSVGVVMRTADCVRLAQIQL